jgi:hypothetical protein
MLQPHFVNLFTVGLGKWLLKMLSTTRPQWGVRLLGSYAYRVKADSPDMVSLAFEIRGYAQGPNDAFGLSKGASIETVPYDEPKLALELLDGIRQIVDIDIKLVDDVSLYNAMEKETVDLLLSARYKRETIEAGLKRFARASNVRRIH